MLLLDVSDNGFPPLSSPNLNLILTVISTFPYAYQIHMLTLSSSVPFSFYFSGNSFFSFLLFSWPDQKSV